MTQKLRKYTQYLQAFKVDNFRLLTNIPFIQLKPFTFLFGQNGSGKTSFINAFSLFEQIIKSLKTYDWHRTFDINKDKNFGAYDDIININNVDQPIKFSFMFATEEENSFFKHNLYKTPKSVEVTISFVRNKLNSHQMNLDSWEIKDNTSGFHHKASLSDTSKNYIDLGKFSPNKYEKRNYPGIEYVNPILTSSNNDIKHLNFQINFLLRKFKVARGILDFGGVDQEPEDIIDWWPQNRENLEKEFNDEFFNTSKISQDNLFDYEELHLLIDSVLLPYYDFILMMLKKSFTNNDYLPHLRSEIPRAFFLGDLRSTSEEDSLYQNLLNLQRFKHLQKGDISGSRMAKKPYLKETLNNALVDLKLGDSFSLESHNGIYQVFIEKNGTKINIADDSSGLKQLFPIIIKVLTSSSSGKPNDDDYNFLTLEQPELHLHPKLQSKLMEFLINYSTKSILLIETHSEHMIKKIQIMFAKGEISDEDLNICYFNSESGKTKIRKMEIDKDGLFKEDWPDGFFDDKMNLTFELLDVIRARNN